MSRQQAAPLCAHGAIVRRCQPISDKLPDHLHALTKSGPIQCIACGEPCPAGKDGAKDDGSDYLDDYAVFRRGDGIGLLVIHDGSRLTAFQETRIVPNKHPRRVIPGTTVNRVRPFASTWGGEASAS